MIPVASIDRFVILGFFAIFVLPFVISKIANIRKNRKF